MGGNPIGSRWRSTPDADRNRPHFRGTVPRELVEEVRELAASLGIEGRGADSKVLEEALRLWVAKHRKGTKK